MEHYSKDKQRLEATVNDEWKKSLLSANEARLFLWETFAGLSDQQVLELIQFCEHFGLYLIEQYIAWKLK